MAAVVAAVVRGRRAFSGGTAASIVVDVGGGRDGAPRPFGCRAVMIARARSPGRFGTVGLLCERQTRSPAVNACGACGFGSETPPDLEDQERPGGRWMTAPQ
jgi:hypothetical protein